MNEETIKEIQIQKQKYVEAVSELERQYRKGVITYSELQQGLITYFATVKNQIFDLVWQEN